MRAALAVLVAALALPGVAAAACAPAAADALGPYYVPGAPARTSVGQGYVLTGTVRTAGSCRAVPRAKVELWLAGPGGEYGPAWRATLRADARGRYRFTSHVPPSYESRPPHVHVRVSAPGYRVLVTQHYPRAGAARATFDLNLRRR